MTPQHSQNRPTKNERRQAAREQARLAREAEKKKAKRNRNLVKTGVVVVALAIAGVIGLVIFDNTRPPGPGPKNMASGGFILEKDMTPVSGPALKSGKKREPVKTNREKLPIDVTVYYDYMCPGCGAFEQQHKTLLENFAGAGDITMQLYPLSFLDRYSQGTEYSTRAANLFACTADQQPENAYKLHSALFDKSFQPEENSTGKTSEELLKQAETAGVKTNQQLRACMKNRQFEDFIAGNTKTVLETGIIGLEPDAQLSTGQKDELQEKGKPQRLIGTPLIIVNGKEWQPNRDGTLESYLLKLKSELQKTAEDAKPVEHE